MIKNRLLEDELVLILNEFTVFAVCVHVDL